MATAVFTLALLTKTFHCMLVVVKLLSIYGGKSKHMSRDVSDLAPCVAISLTTTSMQWTCTGKVERKQNVPYVSEVLLDGLSGEIF